MICKLEKFGLTINPEKTKLIQFGRFAFKDYQRGKSSRPKTFDFLGFYIIGILLETEAA